MNSAFVNFLEEETWNMFENVCNVNNVDDIIPAFWLQLHLRDRNNRVMHYFHVKMIHRNFMLTDSRHIPSCIIHCCPNKYRVSKGRESRGYSNRQSCPYRKFNYHAITSEMNIDSPVRNSTSIWSYFLSFYFSTRIYISVSLIFP